MAPNEPILLLCHGFPPVRGIGGRRWAKFAKELARRGHPVHVIRSATAHGAPASLWTGDAVHPLIHHHVLPRRFPAVMSKRPLTSILDKVHYKLWSNILPMLGKGNWLDATLLWRKPLLAEASKLIEQYGIRQVTATGAPFRMLAYGAELKQRFPQARLVIDLRDEWTQAGHYGLGTKGPRRLEQEREFEATAVRTADKVVSPHAKVLEEVRQAFPECARNCVLLPHAVDPEDVDFSIKPKLDGQFRMIYAGSMYGGKEAEHYFSRLMEALEALQQQHPDAFAHFRFDLYITSRGTDWYQQQVAARGWQDRVVFHAPLAPRDVLSRIRAANLVVLFIPKVNKDILGTKLQEIFYAGTPMLHVGEPGLVSRTIEERHMGASLRVEELATELPRIISGGRTVECDRNADHSDDLLPNVVERLVREVLA